MMMRVRVWIITAVLLLSALLAEAADSKQSFFGFAFSFQHSGPMRLAVCAVMPKGPAEQAGLRQDDRIVAVDGRADFKNAYEVLSYLLAKHAGDKMELSVGREKEDRKISIVGAEATEKQISRMQQNLRLAKEE